MMFDELCVIDWLILLKVFMWSMIIDQLVIPEATESLYMFSKLT